MSNELAEGHIRCYQNTQQSIFFDDIISNVQYMFQF